MMNMHTVTTAMAGVLISGILSQPAFAQETDTDVVSTEAVPEESKFADPELLIETLLKDEEQALEETNESISDAEAALEDAEQALSEAESDTDITDEELQELEQAVADAEEQLSLAREDLATIEENLSEEEERTTGLVEGELTDEQIVNLNRSLNNANASGLTVDLDADDLQAVIDGEYNLQQINMLTKSAEAEARFDSLADKFEMKAEEMDNEKFLEHSGRMADRADTERDKFRDRIGQFDSLKDKSIQGAAKNEARRSAKAEARLAAKQSSRDVAKGLAKQAAKDAAKQAAKENARENAKENARQIVKEEGKQAARSQGKGKGLDNNPN